MTYVKICGITNLEDALRAAALGADLLGFVFHPPSPRCVTPEMAREISAAVRREAPSIRTVGVFVDLPPETVRAIAAQCGLDCVQLHGSEPPAAAAYLTDAGFEVFKAFRVRDGSELNGLDRYRVAAYLLDAYSPAHPGGTGRTFDWDLAARATEHGRIILAGGLTPDNVAAAIRAVRPWGVDVSTGVEAAPGRKDHSKLERFIAAVRGIPKEDDDD